MRSCFVSLLVFYVCICSLCDTTETFSTSNEGIDTEKSPEQWTVELEQHLDKLEKWIKEQKVWMKKPFFEWMEVLDQNEDELTDWVHDLSEWIEKLEKWKERNSEYATLNGWGLTRDFGTDTVFLTEDIEGNPREFEHITHSDHKDPFNLLVKEMKRVEMILYEENAHDK